MAQLAVSSVLGSVGNLAVHETRFLSGVTLEVALLKDELMRLQGYIKDADNKWRSGNARVSVLVNQIKTAAYEAENVIEAVDYMEKRNRLKKGFIGAISRYARLLSNLVTLHKVGAEVQRVRRKLNEIFESAERLKIDLDNSDVVVPECPQDYDLMHQSIEEDVVMVGFEEEYTEIVEKILDKENMLSVVSIVAMGGAGKTTLARKVFTLSRIKQHFQVVAWVNVSQAFKVIDLLKDIMKQFVEDTDEIRLIDQMQENEVGKKMHEFLLSKKYLVVLDDVWEDDTWDQINGTVKAFPNANNGSRILLTTRKEKVAHHVELPTHVHALKHLNEEKSWELFRSKALPPYRRHFMDDVDEFENIGIKLARKCDGLPLALTVLGGYLSKNPNIEAWSDILLCWPSTRNTQMMQDILARSYKDMKNHYLRYCFLYLATFPDDHIIDVWILVSLWIAEGFIPRVPKCEPEETARKYLTELAQRSLVQVCGRSNAHGWIEKIRVHDILRDWCIEEARRDGFLDVIDKTSGQLGAPSIDIMTSYRSSYQGFNDPHLQETSNLRALLSFQVQPISLPKLRFLRVLHIENSRLRDFSKAIGGCIHLRCLRLISCEDVTLPSSIGKLIYLQTIDTRGTQTVAPKSMWDIPSLRHVSLSSGFPPPKGVKQKDLQTLCLSFCFASTWFSSNLDIVRFLGQMTQLTTLDLEPYATMTPEIMQVLANMPRLVDIALRRLSAFDKLPESHRFPQSLRSFDISAVELRQDPLPVLEKLPCLVVLKLTGFSGQTMSCSSRGFPRLQNLQLRTFPIIEEWKIEAGAMPKLSHLVLFKFTKMNKLPEGLLHLPSLKDVKLFGMPLISYGDNSRSNELKQKGCQVTIYVETDIPPPGTCEIIPLFVE